MTAPDEWWRRDWHCRICNTSVKQSHKARHAKSMKHQKLDKTQWPTLSSDESFLEFLETIKPRDFSHSENKIFYAIITL